MLQRLLSCVALATALALPGCGGGDTTPAAPTTAPAFVPASQTTTVGNAGGTVSLTAADGTQYTLAVPAGALARDTALSLTTAEPGEGQRFRVVAGPDGLVFQAGLPATLTIRLPAGRELPTAGGLIYNGSPVASTRNADGSIVLQLYQLSGSAVAKAGLAQLAQVLGRLRPASAVEGSVLVCRSPNVDGGPQAGTASYDALDLESHLDCATAQIEDAVAADNFRGAAALALSLDELFQRASLTGSPFLDRAKALVCEGRQRALDTLTSVTITDLDDLQVIERVAQWDMFAQKLGHTCAGQPGLTDAVQPKIDDALTLMDVDPDNISAADVSSSGYVEFKDSVDRTLQLRHRLVAIARSLGRPSAPIAPAGVRERAQAANDYTAEALASAQLQGRVEPAALKNLLPAPWARCRNAGDYAPLMALVDIYGVTASIAEAVQYCGTQLQVVESLDASAVRIDALAQPLGGVSAGVNRISGRLRASELGFVTLIGPIASLRCPSGSGGGSEQLLIKLDGTLINTQVSPPYLNNVLSLNLPQALAAAHPGSALGRTSATLTLERDGTPCNGAWGAAPAPLMSLVLDFKPPPKIAFYRWALSTRPGYVTEPVGTFVMNADGSSLTQLTDDMATGVYGGESVPSWSPDGRKFVIEARATVRPVTSCTILQIINVDGSGTVSLQSGNPILCDKSPSWSPDGTKIAFARNDVDNYTWKIYTKAVTGGAGTQLTDGVQGDDRHPQWSPDGTKIAFSRSGVIYVMDADGSGQRSVGIAQTNYYRGADDFHGESDFAPTWSPDGSKIAFWREVRENGQPVKDKIMVASSSGGGASQLVEVVHPGQLWIGASWSPDGTTIIYSAGDRTGQSFSTYSIPAAGGSGSALSNGSLGVWPGFSR